MIKTILFLSTHLPAPVALPEQLNLMNDVVGTLIDKIVDLTNQDQAQTGVNVEEQAATTTEPIKNLQCWPVCCNGKVCPQNGRGRTFEKKQTDR